MTQDLLKPVGFFIKPNTDYDPLTAHFKYVADHKRKLGIIGAVREVWRDSTYPDVMREIAKLRKSGNDDRADTLTTMAEAMEKDLDFTFDEIGEHSGLVMSGMR